MPNGTPDTYIESGLTDVEVLAKATRTADGREVTVGIDAASLAATLSVATREQVSPPFITNPDGLVRWRQALAGAFFGQAPICYVGDSHTYGEWWDGSTNQTGNATALLKSPAAQLRDLFAASYGATGEGFVFPSDSRVTSGGGVSTGVYSGPSVIRNNRLFTSASHTLTLTIPAGITRLGSICANRTNETGVLSVTRNGVATTSVTPDDSNTPSVTEFVCSPGDVFVFTGENSKSHTTLGFTFGTSQTVGVPVHRMGQMGYTVPTMGGGSENGVLWKNSSTLLSDAQVQTNIRAIYKWQEVVTGGGKGVVIIQFATNEQSKQLDSSGQHYGITPDLYGEALTTIVQQIADDGWCSLLVSPCPSGSELTTTGAEPLTSYAAEAKAVALANDHTAFIDIADLWGGGFDPYTGELVSSAEKAAAIAAAATAELRDPTSSHPTPKGYGDYARFIYRALTSMAPGN